MISKFEIEELADDELVLPANDVPGAEQGQWTYADYAKIPDDGNRYEIIEGVLYQMPSPNRNHQDAISYFIYWLMAYVQMVGLGKVYAAPFDVKLPLQKHVVQPDIIVILKNNEQIITAIKIEGAPDLVIEISSPGTAGYDRNQKQTAYAKAGITEYWIADPSAKTIEVLSLQKNTYQSLGVFDTVALLPSKVIPNLPVKIEQFFG